MTTNKTTKTSRAPTQRSVKDMLQSLAAAEGTRRAAAQRVDDAVSMLRSPDGNGYCLASWAEVGAALGITKQAAMQRYNRKGL